jgi:hypothetical protein
MPLAHPLPLFAAGKPNHPKRRQRPTPARKRANPIGSLNRVVARQPGEGSGAY